jgi:hypothetical protein
MMRPPGLDDKLKLVVSGQVVSGQFFNIQTLTTDYLPADH